SRMCTEIRTSRIREIYRHTKLQERTRSQAVRRKMYLVHIKKKETKKSRKYHIAPRK
ncbi:hypothetical protein ALC57_14456, partial [Trachymyrmex cornetzi]